MSPYWTVNVLITSYLVTRWPWSLTSESTYSLTFLFDPFLKFLLKHDWRWHSSLTCVPRMMVIEWCLRLYPSLGSFHNPVSQPLDCGHSYSLLHWARLFEVKSEETHLHCRDWIPYISLSVLQFRCGWKCVSSTVVLNFSDMNIFADHLWLGSSLWLPSKIVEMWIDLQLSRSSIFSRSGHN